MKLLFITHQFYPAIGGIEVNSEVLATHFHQMGVDVKLVTWTPENGNKTFPFPVIRHPNLSTLIQLHRWADIVYENNPCLHLVWPAIFFKKPSVVALRTWITRVDGKIGWQEKIKQLWLRRATAVIAISEAVRKRSWREAVVIGNPYRANLFKVNPNIPKNTDFAFLGRLVSDKGADLAINAFHLFLKEHEQSLAFQSSCKLTIIGEGPERRNLEELACSLSIANQVVFTGTLQGEELVNCLNKHKYLLVPSLWEEPFGNVALEGMACGCIPIVSDGGGLPDAVGKAGLAFKSGNVAHLIETIKKVYFNEQLQKLLRLNAKQHLQNHHPVEVASAYLRVIEGAEKNYTN